MSGATTPHAYPYPLGTDLVSDGDNTLAALATMIDTKLGVWAAGTATVPIVAAGTGASIAVTFPVGRFTAAPVVVCSPEMGNPFQDPRATAINATTSGFTCWAARMAGTAALAVWWRAVQV